MSAMPIGMPGCPELAFCTASIARARIALASCRRRDVCIRKAIQGRARVEGRAFWTKDPGRAMQGWKFRSHFRSETERK